MTFADLQPKVIEILEQSAVSRDEKLLQICQLLESNIDYYTWVGFYFANHETQTLHLGPYVGAATDHTVIPFGKGICGQVAVSNQNFVVNKPKEADFYKSRITYAESALTKDTAWWGENRHEPLTKLENKS